MTSLLATSRDTFCSAPAALPDTVSEGSDSRDTSVGSPPWRRMSLGQGSEAGGTGNYIHD